MKVTIEPDRCVGSGQCVMAAPTVFDLDDNGIVVLLEDETSEAQAVRDAINLCPARAIFASGAE